MSEAGSGDDTSDELPAPSRTPEQFLAKAKASRGVIPRGWLPLEPGQYVLSATAVEELLSAFNDTLSAMTNFYSSTQIRELSPEVADQVELLALEKLRDARNALVMFHASLQKLDL